MDYKIPLFDLNYGAEEEIAVLETIRSKWISSGPKCEELEKTFAGMFKVKHAKTVSNCTAALHLACYLLGLKKGDEVICPSLTFAATVNAIKYVDATPVFCDITSCDNMNINPAEIERLITPNTKAIMVMHFAGFPCEMDRIVEIAKKNNLKIIEDACHGPLSEYKGKKLGTIGDIGCFSFFSNKNISTGEGGMIITNNDTYAEKIKLLRSHGMTTMSYQRAKGHATAYDINNIGFNYRMDDIRASLGIAQLHKLTEDLGKRAENREIYLKCLKRIENLYVPFQNNSEFVSNYIMPIVLKNSNEEKRDLIREKLHSFGIQTSVHYPSIHTFSVYAKFEKNLPVTEYVTKNEITLPMYGSLTKAEIQYICNKLEESMKSI